MGNSTSSTAGKEYYGYEPDDWPYVWAMLDPECLDWKNYTKDETEMAEVWSRHGSIQYTPIPVSEDRYLFLGSAGSVKKVDMLREMGISHVLNMAGPPAAGPVEEYRAVGIMYHQIDAEDEEGYPLFASHLQEALNFIRMSRESINHSKCVVHCVAGMNRSVAIVAAELMLSQKRSVLQVMRDLRRWRGNSALCNKSFQEQLVALARKNNLLGVAPGLPGSIVNSSPPPDSSSSKKNHRNYKECLGGLAG